MNIISFELLIGIILLTDTLYCQNNDQKTCPIFSCASSTAAVNGSCFNNITGGNISKIIITDCPTNQQCAIGPYNIISKTGKSSLSCTTIKINTFSGLSVGNLVEYDYCIKPDDCASKNCTLNICYGKPLGNACSNTTECKANAYCGNGICLERKSTGSICTDHIECFNNASCLNNVCTERWSVKTGQKIISTNLVRDMSIFCYSKYANQEGICEDLINSGSSPYYCEVKKGCDYVTSITKRIVTLTDNYCSCNLFGNGYANCMLSTTSVSWANDIKSQLNLLNVGCHYYNRNKCSLTNFTLIKESWYSNANISNMFVGDYDCVLPKEIPVNPALCPNPTCDDTGKVFMHNTSSDGRRIRIGACLLVLLFLLILL